MKAALLLGCAGFAVTAGLVPATVVLAQTRARPPATYTLPAQDLGDALTQLARQSGREIVVSSDLVRGLRTTGVSGRGGFEPTLNALLAGTGLSWRVNAGGAVIVERGNAQADAGPEAATEIDDVVVTGARPSMAAERYRSAVPVEVMTQADFGRYTGSDVADLMIRIPGVSVSTEGNFAVIRGLSERYNTVTFDGMVLPSSDPERQSVELDQFPSRLLEGIMVYKAFSPEQPGNLSGGGVELRPLRFPERRILSFSIGASASEDVFTGDSDFLTYETGGHGDLWGRGSEDRVATDAVLTAVVYDEIAPSADRPFTATSDDMPFGPRASFVYGDRFRLDNGVRIGVTAAATYDSSYSTETGTVHEGDEFTLNGDGEVIYDQRFVCRNNDVIDCVIGEQTPVPRDGHSYVRSEQDVSLGALANVAVRFNENHEISLTGFTSQTATDTAQYDDDIIDFSNSNWPTPHSGAQNPGGASADTAWRYRYTLNYRERNLSTLALVGDHAINGGQLSWALAHSAAYQDEPDNRRLLYLNPYGTDYYIVAVGGDNDQAIYQTWRKIEEAQDNLRLSWRQPLGQTEAFFEFGGSHSSTARDYVERQAYGTVDTVSEAEGLGYTGTRRFDSPHDIWEYIDSRWLGANASVALTRDISALYFLGETPLFTPDLTLSGGVRFERTLSQSSGFGNVPGNSHLSSAWHYLANYYFYPDLPRATGVTPELEAAAQSDIDQVDFLPSLNLAWRPTGDLTVRLGASQTTARPSLREMGNYYTWDPDAERYDHGNATLQLSRVRNLDVRAEYRFDTGGFASLSLFRKEIENPIEGFLVSHPSSSDKVGTWFNNPSTAELEGAEVEFRSGFGFAGRWLGQGWGDALAGLTLGGNATWIDAEVLGFTSASGTGIYATDTKRRLYDQPEWILNLDLGYEHAPWGSSVTLSYIAISEVLTYASNGLDEYRDKTSRLDLVFSQRLTDRYSLKFSARNLLDPEQLYVRDRDQAGGAEIVDRRWRDGRSYSLALTAEF